MSKKKHPMDDPKNKEKIKRAEEELSTRAEEIMRFLKTQYPEDKFLIMQQPSFDLDIEKLTATNMVYGDIFELEDAMDVVVKLIMATVAKKKVEDLTAKEKGIMLMVNDILNKME